MSQQIGFAAEQQVRTYLVKQGLRWLTSNYHCRWGEIDLIMQEGNYLVFVEVRSRVSAEYGGAIESITYQKKRKIIKTATYYLSSKNWHDKYPVRFDVVSLQGSALQMEWIKNAFDAD